MEPFALGRDREQGEAAERPFCGQRMTIEGCSLFSADEQDRCREAERGEAPGELAGDVVLAGCSGPEPVEDVDERSGDVGAGRPIAVELLAGERAPQLGKLRDLRSESGRRVPGHGHGV